MRRRTFDALLAVGGLIVGDGPRRRGGLLMWANNFVDDQVQRSSSAQKISFPEAGSESPTTPTSRSTSTRTSASRSPPGAGPGLRGPLHRASTSRRSAGGKTYSELSASRGPTPTTRRQPAAVQTAFRGETLRGLLLNAYAFWQMGQIALYGAIAAFAGAAMLLMLSILGLLHLRRTPARAGGPTRKRCPGSHGLTPTLDPEAGTVGPGLRHAPAQWPHDSTAATAAARGYVPPSSPAAAG